MSVISEAKDSFEKNVLGLVEYSLDEFLEMFADLDNDGYLIDRNYNSDNLKGDPLGGEVDHVCNNGWTCLWYNDGECEKGHEELIGYYHGCPDWEIPQIM